MKRRSKQLIERIHANAGGSNPVLVTGIRKLNVEPVPFIDLCRDHYDSIHPISLDITKDCSLQMDQITAINLALFILEKGVSAWILHDNPQISERIKKLGEFVNRRLATAPKEKKDENPFDA